ncbi:ADP-ribosylglycohydrolase family protein [Streptomyces sp. NPDC005876]|uniref:ADP-ribosylglycohydrolase family protein n=1 Tax=Streptomyces sp. NPDC005876 TaxID=3157076 RepID=UPI0033ED4DE6
MQHGPVDQLGTLTEVLQRDAAGIDFRSAAVTVANECRAALEAFDPTTPLSTETYAALVQRWGGFDDATRGSGTITTLLAAVLAHACADSPEAGLLLAANTLGSDTDTIATMAGALLGVVTAGPPPGTVQDVQLIDSEARRMWDISQGREASTFAYPDLLRWSPPKATLDLVGHTPMGPALAGLGPLTPTDHQQRVTRPHTCGALCRSARASLSAPGRISGHWMRTCSRGTCDHRGVGGLQTSRKSSNSSSKLRCRLPYPPIKGPSLPGLHLVR